MPICPLHRQVYLMDAECAQCVKGNMIALSVEYDKQDRVRDTMTYLGNEFDPTKSRAIMVFYRAERKQE